MQRHWTLFWKGKENKIFLMVSATYYPVCFLLFADLQSCKFVPYILILNSALFWFETSPTLVPYLHHTHTFTETCMNCFSICQDSNHLQDVTQAYISPSLRKSHPSSLNSQSPDSQSYWTWQAGGWGMGERDGGRDTVRQKQRGRGWEDWKEQKHHKKRFASREMMSD